MEEEGGGGKGVKGRPKPVVGLKEEEVGEGAGALGEGGRCVGGIKVKMMGRWREMVLLLLVS
jgi:hypothetical protein